MASSYEYTKEEMLRIIFGKDVFQKCPACDNDGRVYSDENGNGCSPIPRPEWGPMPYSEQCDKCDGLGFILIPKHK